MKNRRPIIVLTGIYSLLLLNNCVSKVSPEALYDGSWESLQEMPVPTWFDDGKIGIFIH